MQSRKTLPFLLLVFVVFFTACKDLVSYKDALDAFSKGATIETTERLTAATSPPAESVSVNQLISSDAQPDEGRDAASYYEEAFKLANQALEGKAQLQKNNLLDNTLAIKALAAWKTGREDVAIQTAAEAEPMLKENQTDENDVRDLAIVQAIPALINIDHAFEAFEEARNMRRKGEDLIGADISERHALHEGLKTLYEQTVTSDDASSASLNRSMIVLQSASDNIQRNEGMKLYLLSAQLAALDTWGDMAVNLQLTVQTLSSNGDMAEELAAATEEVAKYKTMVNEYLGKLETALDGGTNNATYMYWKDIFKGA